MVLRFGPQVLEDDLLHEALHKIPVLHDAVTDWPLWGRVFGLQHCPPLSLFNFLSTGCPEPPRLSSLTR